MSVLKDKAIKDKSRRPGNGDADSDGEKHDDQPSGPADREVVDEAGNEADQAEPDDGEELEEEPLADDALVEGEESVPAKPKAVNVD